MGLTSPELAVLLAYSKMWLFDELVASDAARRPVGGAARCSATFRRCCARSSRAASRATR